MHRKDEDLQKPPPVIQPFLHLGDHPHGETVWGEGKLTPSIGWAAGFWLCHYGALDEKKFWTDSDVCIGGEKKKKKKQRNISNHLEGKMEGRAA